MYCRTIYNEGKEDLPMPRSRIPGQPKKPRATRSLMVRLDEQSKAVLIQAAELRHVSVSDYVREVTLAQARREVLAAGKQTLVLNPEWQLAFWNALNAVP